MPPVATAAVAAAAGMTAHTPSVRPAEKIARALTNCGSELSVYGRCIVADYTGVHKDKCLSEFVGFKNCYIVRILHHWRNHEVMADAWQAAMKQKS